MPDHRRSLLGALGVLATLQLGHLLDGLRTGAQTSLPSVLENPRAVIGIVAAVAVGAAVLTGRRWARPAAVVVGLGTAAAFAMFHAVPYHVGASHPYWGPHGHADLGQWCTVLAIVGAGVTTAVIAARARVLHHDGTGAAGSAAEA